jgi:hypothetical protein
MKKLILSVIVTLFMSTAFANVNVPNPIEDFPNTAKELLGLLGTSHLAELLEEELLVKVRITLNENHEIVVLQAETENEAIESYIKNKLNYKKLASTELKVGTEYFFDVRFKF